MDTRHKLTRLEEAAAAVRGAGRSVAWAGHFDPMLSDHARRAEELRGEADLLVVLVLEPPEPLLPLEARVQLAAGLRGVTLVVAVPDQSAREALAALRATVAIDETARDLDRREELLAHIRRRQALA